MKKTELRKIIREEVKKILIKEGVEDEFLIARELAKLGKFSEEKADRIIDSWKQNAALDKMRKYWKAVKNKNYKSIAKIIKLDWGV